MKFDKLERGYWQQYTVSQQQDTGSFLTTLNTVEQFFNDLEAHACNSFKENEGVRNKLLSYLQSIWCDEAVCCERTSKHDLIFSELVTDLYDPDPFIFGDVLDGFWGCRIEEFRANCLLWHKFKKDFIKNHIETDMPIPCLMDICLSYV